MSGQSDQHDEATAVTAEACTSSSIDEVLAQTGSGTEAKNNEGRSTERNTTAGVIEDRDVGIIGSDVQMDARDGDAEGPHGWLHREDAQQVEGRESSLLRGDVAGGLAHDAAVASAVDATAASRPVHPSRTLKSRSPSLDIDVSRSPSPDIEGPFPCPLAQRNCLHANVFGRSMFFFMPPDLSHS